MLVLDEDYENGSVVIVRYRYHEGKESENNKTYDMALIKAGNGLWYSTLINNVLHGVTYDKVVEWLEDKNIIRASFVTEATMFIKKNKVVQ